VDGLLHVLLNILPSSLIFSVPFSYLPVVLRDGDRDLYSCQALAIHHYVATDDGNPYDSGLTDSFIFMDCNGLSWTVLLLDIESCTRALTHRPHH
jgi:hypothetical protein